MRGLSLVVASGGHSSSRCAGLSLSQPLLLWSTGSRRTGSAIVAHRPSRSAARGILPDQGSNPCRLHRQADSQPPRHQGSPVLNFDTLWVHQNPALMGHLKSYGLTEQQAKSDTHIVLILSTHVHAPLSLNFTNKTHFQK